MRILEQARQAFAEVFGAPATAAGVAPGRVEVLGNHTDYNEGFILSAAIDRHIVVAGRRAPGASARVHAAAFKKTVEFPVAAPAKNEADFWVNYVAGVVAALARRGVEVGGFEAVIDGDVPLGSGLSSSAALEVATLKLLQTLYPFAMDGIQASLTAQEAENQFVGVNCGILDQFSSAMGAKDQLIFLDCRDLAAYKHVPMGAGAQLVLANTNAKHALADGTYNRLRESCFAAARYFAEKLPGRKITHLRDVTVEDFERLSAGLPEETAKRAKHVITENARVLAGVEGLKNGDLAAMGRCMDGSHRSSRDDFGNSCPELNAMFDCAEGLPGLYGRRLSGGGFGGCTVNLVAAGAAEEFAAKLAERYAARTGIQPQMHLCRADDGAKGVQL